MATQPVTEESILQPRGVDNDKRRAIIDAAQQMFTTAGYESTTMAQVASNAGVAVGTVYLYFKNKNDLLIAVKESWEEEVLRALSLPELSLLPHHLRARPMIEACFAICARHSDLVQLIGMQAEMLGDWRSQIPAPIRDALETFLNEALTAGSIRQVDTRPAAVILYGMVNSALMECFCNNHGDEQERYIDSLMDAVQHWLISPDLRSSSPALDR